MKIGGLPPGSQDIVQGVVSVLVLAIARPGRRRRRVLRRGDGLRKRNLDYT
jgi:hypothetical protein